jgi:hypothetical protein
MPLLEVAESSAGYGDFQALYGSGLTMSAPGRGWR